MSRFHVAFPTIVLCLGVSVAHAGDDCPPASSAVVQDIAQAVEASQQGSVGPDLASRIRAAAEGVIFDDLGTEATTETMKVLHVEGEDLGTGTRQEVARVLGKLGQKGTEYAIFESATAPDPEADGNRSLLQRMAADQPQAAKLVELLSTLKDLQVVVIGADDGGEAEHPTYIMGAAADGSVVVVQTMVVWT